MKKTIFAIASAFILANIPFSLVHAENGLVTISVDAEDDNEGLLYAIDDDSPSAFSTSHEFQVYPGTQHTIYVKDAAGNITSSSYTADNPDNTTMDPLCNDAGSSPIGDGSGNTYSPVGGISTNLHYAAEDGQGTVYEKTYTDGSADGEKVFYTVTTKEGEVYYLVIDQAQQNNNVYLLNQVTVSSLQGLAETEGYDFTLNDSKINSNNLLNSLKGNDASSNSINSSNSEVTQDDGNTKNTLVSSSSRSILVVVAVGVAVGGWYYLKKMRTRKDEQMDEIDSAHDLEDFEPEEEEEEEEEFSDEDFLDEFSEEEEEEEEEFEEQEEDGVIVLTDENRDDYMEMDDDDFDDEEEEEEEDLDE